MLITITLPDDIAHETLIALRDRESSLQNDLGNENEVVRAIARRQLERVRTCISVLTAVAAQQSTSDRYVLSCDERHPGNGKCGECGAGPFDHCKRHPDYQSTRN